MPVGRGSSGSQRDRFAQKAPQPHPWDGEWRGTSTVRWAEGLLFPFLPLFFRTADTLEGTAAIQGYPERLEEGVDSSLSKNALVSSAQVRDGGYKAASQKMTWGVLEDEEVNGGQQGALLAKAASHRLGCVSKSAASSLREVILPLCLALAGPRLECSV